MKNGSTESAGVRDKILGASFVCRRCSSCCREIEPGSNLVMVSPCEVRAIMAVTGLSFDDVAEPYPDTITEGKREYTFGWAIRRKNDRCIFLKDDSCQVYENRPWICRTYPFMLDHDTLIISSCPGIGTAIPSAADRADQIVSDLLARRKAEEEEEERIAAILPTISIPPEKRVVIDSEGMRIIPWAK